MAHCLHPAVDNAPFTTRQGCPVGAAPALSPGRRGASPQPRPAPRRPWPPGRAASAPRVQRRCPTATPASRANGGDGAFTRAGGLAKAPLPMAERTPRVSRQSSRATAISVIAKAHESQALQPERVLCEPCFAGDVASRSSWRGNATSPVWLAASGGGHGTSATAFGRKRRQAERESCRGLRQLRQHGASPGRRCERRRRAAARARKAPLAGAVRLCGGTGADPLAPARGCRWPVRFTSVTSAT
jgi:hypothetical protein